MLTGRCAETIPSFGHSFSAERSISVWNPLLHWLWYVQQKYASCGYRERVSFSLLNFDSSLPQISLRSGLWLVVSLTLFRFILNEYSLRFNGWTGVPGEPVPVVEEKDVFDWLGMKYQAPPERNGWYWRITLWLLFLSLIVDLFINFQLYFWIDFIVFTWLSWSFIRSIICVLLTTIISEIDLILNHILFLLTFCFLFFP